MKYRFLAFLLCVGFYGIAQNLKLKEGDLIFQTIDCGPLCDAINQVTAGYNGYDFNHVGMVVFKNNHMYVLEASGKEVKLSSYVDFALKTDLPMYLGRLKKRYRKLIPDAISFGLDQLGMPYDKAYIYDNDKYYCSELIYDCFLKAKGAPVFKLYPMTYKAPGSDEYFKIWADYFDELNIEIPEGKPGCNPGGMSLSKKIKILGVI